MHESLELVCGSLDALSEIVLNSWTDNRTLREVYGWHHPALTRQDLALLPAELAKRMRDADPQSLTADMQSRLQDVPRRLTLLHADTVPHLFNGHGHQAVPAYTATINWLAQILEPLLGWQTLQDNKAMPVHLAKRLRGIQAELDSLIPNKERIEEQIRLIQEATDAAESLPADLHSLKEARNAIKRLSSETEQLYGKMDQRSKDATHALDTISSQQLEAGKLVQQCEEAYRITTTKGLAAAFDQRANRLSNSMWVWVAGLIAALGIGAYLGSLRITLLSAAIAEKEPQWGVVWMHIALSFMSIGAPLWFAWIATKQIGQRFRLAEDYGFKASVAKAYEGYRREAARIDEAFEARLFSSALTRLEEAPLRLVEDISHGSPWHELVASDAFQKALAIVPELKDKFIELAKATFTDKSESKKVPTNPDSAAQ